MICPDNDLDCDNVGCRRGGCQGRRPKPPLLRTLCVGAVKALPLLEPEIAGGAVAPTGDLHPDLANRLAGEASKIARRVCNICIRALDYCPPVDISFGETITAPSAPGVYSCTVTAVVDGTARAVENINVTVQQNTPGCKVTDGGRITASNGDKATLGGVAKVSASGTPSAAQEYQDHGPAAALNVLALASLTAVLAWSRRQRMASR